MWDRCEIGGDSTLFVVEWCPPPKFTSTWNLRIFGNRIFADGIG